MTVSGSQSCSELDSVFATYTEGTCDKVVPCTHGQSMSSTFGTKCKVYSYFSQIILGALLYSAFTRLNLNPSLNLNTKTTFMRCSIPIILESVHYRAL